MQIADPSDQNVCTYNDKDKRKKKISEVCSTSGNTVWGMNELTMNFVN